MKHKLTRLKFLFLIAVMIVTANLGLAYVIRYFSRAQTCFTKEEVASDSRCLYIWDNKVFEKGTRSSPHQGHPCGMDVSSLIPSFHMADMAKYLDPNYKGNICSAKSSPTTTPTVTYTPTPLPTVTSVPPTPTAVVPPVGGILPTAISSITVTLFPTPTLTVTPAPVCTLPAPVVSIKVVCPLCQ